MKSANATAVKQEKRPLNTENVTVEATFMASADDLYQVLTDESKISMWTHAAAQVRGLIQNSTESTVIISFLTLFLQSKPEPGAPFSLFGGGVKGTYVTLEPPKKIVQKWALSSPTWPSGNSNRMFR